MSAKPLVLSDIRARAGAFAAQWRDAEGYERGEAQEFVRGLLGAFGISGRTAAVYEKRAQRASTGQRGYIDALISGTALIEMKSRGRDLATAENQALDYIESLSEHERPDYVITSDFARFRVLDLTAEAGTDAVLEFSLEELPVHVEDLMFLAGYRRTSFGSVEQEKASIEAARLMAKLYEHLDATGYDEHQASIFLIRTLFCLYADDSGLWERDLFSRYIEERTSEDGSDLGAQLATLYQALNRPEEKRYAKDDDLIQAFPYVNGSVFGEAIDIPYFDRAGRDLLLQAAYFNWSSISPAIFGSLFQAVKDKKARRALGEHYTTETNILKLIRPLFLDELEERFEKAWAKKGDLEKLLVHLGELQFLDPACGCGNFLIIAYRELRALELRIHERLQELDPARTQLSLDAESLVHVKLSQFHGIEIEEWPATIARTAMFLVEHQANQAVNLTLGYAVPMLPLADAADVHVGNALRMDWSEVVEPTEHLRIMGNPPFLGDHTRSTEQLQELRDAWGGNKTLSRLDYVTGWHAKALNMFRKAPRGVGRWAFVTTNSIAQGDQTERLFSEIFADGWRILFAHQTFAWSSEAPGAAAVHCVIIGFTKDPAAKQRLFTYPTIRSAPAEVNVTTGVNAYLLDGMDVLVGKRSTPLSSEVTMPQYGSKPTDGGHLTVEPEDYAEVADDPIAARYLRRFLGARELLHGEDRWCLWLTNASPAEISASTVLSARVKAVADFRAKSTAATTRDYPYPQLFRQFGITADKPIVAIPEVTSENRPYLPVMHLENGEILSNKVYGIADPDGLLFALLSSGMFIAWMKAVGGRLESRLSFSSTVTWNNFPVPRLNDKERAAIVHGGVAVLSARADHPERSLAEHYGSIALAPSLRKAHDALDRAVDRAFGARGLLRSEHARQKLLFERYAELTGQN